MREFLADPQRRLDGYFVSGMALGTLGQWRLMRRHMLDAYFIGKKAVKQLKRCLKLDPDYADAGAGLLPAGANRGTGPHQPGDAVPADAAVGLSLGHLGE